MESGGLSPISQITASSWQAEQVPAKPQHCQGWPLATQEVITHRHRCFKISLDVKITANIGFAEREISRGIPQHGPQRLWILNNQVKSRRVGLGRPLCTVPKADGEVARMVILQEQPEDAQRPGRRIVRYVSSLPHPAGPPARSHGDRSRKQGERSFFAIYLKHREICDKLLFKK
jgi:hypothetical protein